MISLIVTISCKDKYQLVSIVCRGTTLAKQVQGFYGDWFIRLNFLLSGDIFLITSSFVSKLPRVCGESTLVTRSAKTNASIHTLTYSLFPLRKVEKENISSDQGVHVSVHER